MMRVFPSIVDGIMHVTVDPQHRLVLLDDRIEVRREPGVQAAIVEPRAYAPRAWR